jgi:hypothetical protein
MGGLARGQAMAAFRAAAIGAGQKAVPQGQAGHGGGTQIAFGGQHGSTFAVAVSHAGKEPWVTACLNACW